MFEQVEFDAPDDGCHAEFARLAGGEATRLLGLARARPVRAVADGEDGLEDFSTDVASGWSSWSGGSRDRVGRGG